MAQISSNWTAPTFSFDEADQPHAWEIFYLTSQDYLEVLRIKPAEEDKEKRGWEQITQMFTGENRQILQNLIDNNKITETDQRTPILALKAIETAIKNKEHHRTSTTTTKANSATTTSNTKCPWKQFYKCIIRYMDSLHAESCEPQVKINTFINAIKNSFPNPAMDLEQNKKCTKQTQTSEQPRKMAQTQTTEQLSSSTPNNDTDSAYNTEPENNNAAHFTRPSYTPKPTESNSTTSHLSTLTHQPKPSTPTASTYHQCTRKTLLPTPPSPARNFNYRNHYKQHIPGPSPRYSTYPTFTRPSPLYNTHPAFSGPANYRYYPQQHIPGPHTAFLTRPYQQTPLLPIPALTGPYQQISGHFQQVYYVPVILPQPLQHYTG